MKRIFRTIMILAVSSAIVAGCNNQNNNTEKNIEKNSQQKDTTQQEITQSLSYKALFAKSNSDGLSFMGIPLGSSVDKFTNIFKKYGFKKVRDKIKDPITGESMPTYFEGLLEGHQTAIELYTYDNKKVHNIIMNIKNGGKDEFNTLYENLIAETKKRFPKFPLYISSDEFPQQESDKKYAMFFNEKIGEININLSEESFIYNNETEELTEEEGNVIEFRIQDDTVSDKE